MSSRFRGAFAVALALAWALSSGGATARAGLVSNYNFDETSGTVVHDSVGTNNGMLVGGAMFAAGQGLQGSGALSLNTATNGFASFGDIFPLTSGTYSMVAWEKTTVKTGQFVLSDHHTGTLNGYFIATGNVGDGSSAASHFYQSDSGVLGSPKDVTDGQWHQLIFVHASGGTSQYYVDGVLQSQGASSAILANDAPFLIGGVAAFGTPSGGFTGLIDQVSVYDNALSAADVAVLYANPLGTVPEPCSVALLGIGLVGSAVVSRRRRSGR